MTETLPNVDENLSADPALRLELHVPWRDRAFSLEQTQRKKDLVKIEAAFPRRALGALSFTTIAGPHNEFQSMLHELARRQDEEGGSVEYAIAVTVFDPRKRQWVEPDNNRYVVDRWTTNIASRSNHFTYYCRQEPIWLNRMVLGRPSGDWRLNNDYDQALEAYNEAERAYDGLVRQLNTAGTAVQEDRFGHTRGNIYAGYRGTDWINRSWGTQRWGTLYVCHLRKRVMMYQPSTRRWIILPENNGSDTDTQRQRMISLGNEIRPARQLLQRRRNALARAERATRETARDGTRFFYNRTPARVLATAWKEGGQRDLQHRWPPGPGERRDRQAKGFWRDWTTTRDGKGRSWVRTTTQGHWEFPLGIGFLDMVFDFQEKGEIDWCTRKGRGFTIVPAGGLEVDQSRRVVLRMNQTVTEATESGDRSQHHSQTFVRTSNGYGYFLSFGPNIASSATPWGRAEATVSESDADSEESALRLTRALRERNVDREVRSSHRSMIIGRDSPIPLVDFMPHHWIGVYDMEDSMSKRIVDQIVVRQQGEGPLTADVELGERTTRNFTQVGRTLSRILGGIDHIQGHIPASPKIEPPEIPTSATYTPPLSDLTASLRHDFETDRPTVVVRASWVSPDRREPDGAGEEEDTSEDLIDDGSSTP